MTRTLTMLLVAFLCEVAHGATEDVTYAQATVDHIGGVLYVDPEDSGDDEQSDPEEIERDERRKRHVELIIKDSNREEEETLPVLILKDGSRESHETATSEMPAFNGDFCGWMRNRNVRNRRIMELTVPVSHDACTYVVKNAGKKKKSSAQCQKVRIKAQLEAGIRGLDIRAYWSDGKIKTFHGKCMGVVLCECADFEDVVNDVSSFLVDNPWEIVFFRVKFKESQKDMEEHGLKDKVNKMFNAKLEKHNIFSTSLRDAKDSTVRNLVGRRQRLVLMFTKDDCYKMVRTYKETQSDESEELVKNIETNIIKRYVQHQDPKKRMDERTPTWLSAQTTAFWKTYWGDGYDVRAQLTAKLLLEYKGGEVLRNIIKTTRGNTCTKLYNFVGMDMVHDSEGMNQIVIRIIQANQCDKGMSGVKRGRNEILAADSCHGPKCQLATGKANRKCQLCRGTGERRVQRPGLRASSDAWANPHTDTNSDTEDEDDRKSNSNDTVTSKTIELDSIVPQDMEDQKHPEDRPPKQSHRRLATKNQRNLRNRLPQAA